MTPLHPGGPRAWHRAGVQRACVPGGCDNGNRGSRPEAGGHPTPWQEGRGRPQSCSGCLGFRRVTGDELFLCGWEAGIRAADPGPLFCGFSGAGSQRKHTLAGIPPTCPTSDQEQSAHRVAAGLPPTLVPSWSVCKPLLGATFFPSVPAFSSCVSHVKLNHSLWCLEYDVCVLSRSVVSDSLQARGL